MSILVSSKISNSVNSFREIIEEVLNTSYMLGLCNVF